jgi:hypothetical protein
VLFTTLGGSKGSGDHNLWFKSWICHGIRTIQGTKEGMIDHKENANASYLFVSSKSYFHVLTVHQNL